MSREQRVTGKMASVGREVEAAECRSCLARAHCILFKLRTRHGVAKLVPIKRDLKSKETLFSEGDPAREFQVLAKGTMVISRRDPAGDLLFVEHARAGRILEYRSFAPQARHLASARARGPAEVCSAPTEVIRKLIETGGAAVFELLQQAGRELEQVQHSMLLRAARPMHARVQLALQMFALSDGRQSVGGEWHVELPVQRRDLAAMVGARPETISRIIHWMEEEGLARFNGRHVEIPSLDLLVAAHPPAK